MEEGEEAGEEDGEKEGPGCVPGRERREEATRTKSPVADVLGPGRAALFMLSVKTASDPCLHRVGGGDECCSSRAPGVPASASSTSFSLLPHLLSSPHEGHLFSLPLLISAFPPILRGSSDFPLPPFSFFPLG